MGLFDFFKKKNNKREDTLDFIKNLRDEVKKYKLDSNKPNTDKLVFKSNEAAFQYTEKFFSSSPMIEKGLYYGILAMPTLAKISVEHNGKRVVTFVNVVKHPDLKSTIKVGDFILIGIEEVRKVFDVNYLDKMEKETDSKKQALNIAIALTRDASRGLIVKKCSTELNLKTNQFEIDE